MKEMLKPPGKMNSKTKGRKFEILRARDGDNCWLCLKPIDFDAERGVDPLSATLDHVVPKYLGGRNHSANLRLAHLRCNNFRGYVENPEVVARRNAR